MTLKERDDMRVFWGRRLFRFARRGIIVTVGFISLTLILVVPMVADHLEGKQQALGKPEHRLSGIDVYKTTIAEVIKIYGEPTGKLDVPAEGVKDGVGGERKYTWERNGVQLVVWTGYHNSHESGVYSVAVWGITSNGEIGKSGCGLTLGSTLQQQKVVYGDRFFVSSTYGKQLPSGPDPNGKVKSVLLEWHDGTQMTIDYDPSGIIAHMELSANIE